MTDHSQGEPPTVEDCATTIWEMQSFLHGELSEAEADEIRQHLMECEECLDCYDSETLITAMIRRCFENCHGEPSIELRARVASLHIEL